MWSKGGKIRNLLITLLTQHGAFIILLQVSKLSKNEVSSFTKVKPEEHYSPPPLPHCCRENISLRALLAINTLLPSLFSPKRIGSAA